MPISDEALSQIPEDAGSYIDAATALEQPATESVINDGKHDLSAEHVLGHVGLQDLLGGKLHDKLLRTLEKSDDPMVANNEALGHIEKAVSRHGQAVSDGIKDVFLDKATKPSEQTLSPEQHVELAKRVNHLANHPEGLINELNGATQLLSAVAPKISSGVQETAARAVSFLSSKAALPPPEASGDEYQPSQAEASQFHRYLSVVEKPTRALDQLKDGSLTPETVETLQTVYPKLYDHMKTSLLSELKPETPYRTKLLVSQFLGTPVDSSLAPQAVASLQATFAPPQPPAGPKKMSAKAAEKIDLAKRTSLHPDAGD